MTTPLDSFRDVALQAANQLSLTPPGPPYDETGQPTLYGQADIFGNIGYLNALEVVLMTVTDIQGVSTPWPGVGVSQGGTNVPLTVNQDQYFKLGPYIVASLSVTFTGAGATPNDIILVNPPFPPLFTPICVGSFMFTHGTTVNYAGSVIATSPTNLKFMAGGSDATNLLNGFLGNTGGPPFAIASGDTLSIAITYLTAQF